MCPKFNSENTLWVLRNLLFIYFVPSDPTAWPLNIGPIGCPETSVTTNLCYVNPRRTKILFTPRRTLEVTILVAQTVAIAWVGGGRWLGKVMEAVVTQFAAISRFFISGGTDENHDKCLSGWPVTQSMFELSVFEIQLDTTYSLWNVNACKKVLCQTFKIWRTTMIVVIFVCRVVTYLVSSCNARKNLRNAVYLRVRLGTHEGAPSAGV